MSDLDHLQTREGKLLFLLEQSLPLKSPENTARILALGAATGDLTRSRERGFISPKLYDKIHSSTLLLDAFELNCPHEMLSQLLPFSNPSAVNANGESALMLAAKRAYWEGLRFLIPISDLEAKDTLMGRSALMHAVAAMSSNDEPERQKCIEFLLEAGANPGGADKHGLSLLMIAAEQRPLDVIKLILPLSDPADLDLTGMTALTRALQKKHEDTAIELLACCDPKQADIYGRDAAYFAAERGLGDFLRALSHQRADALDRPQGSPTLLMIAASAGSEAGVQALIPLSDPQAVDADGSDALMIAIEQARDSPSLAWNLLPLANLELIDCLGESALDKARSRGFDELAEAIETRKLSSAYKNSQKAERAQSAALSTPVRASSLKI